MNSIDIPAKADVADLGDICRETRGSSHVGADEGTMDNYYLGAGLDRGE